VSLGAAALARYFSGDIHGAGHLAAVLTGAMLAGWVGSVIACRDLCNAILVSLRWKTASAL
jgi:hypothetical protein